MTAAERIAEIRGRLAAATPGVWQHRGGRQWAPRADFGDTYTARTTEDAKFIVHAPADIAYLLRRVQKLEQKIITLRGVLSVALNSGDGSDKP
jgi:hypothetical protein